MHTPHLQLSLPQPAARESTGPALLHFSQSDPFTAKNSIHKGRKGSTLPTHTCPVLLSLTVCQEGLKVPRKGTQKLLELPLHTLSIYRARKGCSELLGQHSTQGPAPVPCYITEQNAGRGRKGNRQELRIWITKPFPPMGAGGRGEFEWKEKSNLEGKGSSEEQVKGDSFCDDGTQG